MVDEIVNDGNRTSSSRPYAFQRKRLLNDSAELNAADKTTKPFKSLKIQSLLDEIINDGSPEKSPCTISQAIPPNASVLQKEIPKPPPEIVAEVFPEKALPKSSPEVVVAVFQEKEQPDESTPRTKEYIIGFIEVSESDDEFIDVTDIKPNVKCLPATLERLRKRFHELYTDFTPQGKHEQETNLCFSWISCCGNA